MNCFMDISVVTLPNEISLVKITHDEDSANCAESTEPQANTILFDNAVQEIKYIESDNDFLHEINFIVKNI